MKKLITGIALLIGVATLQGQVVYNPNVAIKPIPTLTVYKVETADKETSITIRIRNDKGLAPFTLKSKELYIRRVGEMDNLKLLRWEKAPFSPDRKVFSFLNEIFEFTLIFQALPAGTKYFDLIENTPSRDFYIQGIVLDTELNRLITRGFTAFERGDRAGALDAFTEMAEKDLYFEYGLAYFNIIYLLTQMNRIQEAKEWYARFQERFFYDKQLLENELVRLGIRSKLN
ncbi:MAG: hypothetical protein R6V75_11285 [Bacteroidales bacterium]